ncbi:hypothetical protein C8J57DRAFT_991259, partial [Mycena rebaudengoi]
SNNSTIRRGPTVLNAGTSQGSGSIGSMKWQATGLLEKGCTVSTISDCYHISLTSNPRQQLDTGNPDSPRQRDEFHFPQVNAGVPFSYTWKQHLYASTGSSASTFFHLMQVFGVAEKNPLVTLDAVGANMRIRDYVRGTGGSSCGASACPTTALDDYRGKTMMHRISGKFGPSGSLAYKVTNDAGATVLSYLIPSGNMGADAGYIKFGLYRAAYSGMTNANAAVGDWSG